MRLGQRRCATSAKVPAIVAVLAASGVIGTKCWEETCQNVESNGPDARVGERPGGAALLQHRSHRTHTISETEAGEIFPDGPGEGCTVGSSCAAGGIPESRGACVQTLTSAGDAASECWDICNVAHEPEDYTTGDADHQSKLAMAVRGVRAGNYPHMRCPELSNLGVEESAFEAPAETSDAQNILTVMEGVKEAEQAAERARLLTSAAKRESVALGDDTEGSKEAAEVMRLAATAEAEAAQKARKASEDLKRLSESRRAEALATEATNQAAGEEAERKEEAAEAKAVQEAELEKKADEAEEVVNEESQREGTEEVPLDAPTPTIVNPATDSDSDVNKSDPMIKELHPGSGALPEEAMLDNSSSNDFYLGSGCCFSFGYGGMMEPCCLSAGPVVNRSLCEEQANLTGGQTSFTYGRCPSTASEAEAFVLGEEVTTIANNAEPLYGDTAATVPDGDEQKLQEELSARIQAVDESLEQAKLDSSTKQTLASAKLESVKNMEALAMAASRKAKDAAAEVDDMDPEKGEKAASEARKKQTLAEKAEFDAKSANSEAKEAALNATEADLTVKRHEQWKRVVECKIANEKTTYLKREMDEFGTALEQVQGLKANKTSMEDLKGNLVAAMAVKAKQMQEAQNVENERKQALQEAQKETSVSSTAADNARVEAEKSKLEVDDAFQAMSDEGKAAADAAAKAKNADCAWVPVDPCVQEFSYKGKNYVGCTDTDRYVPWCSHDAIYTADSANWSTCTYSCGGASTNSNADNGTGGNSNDESKDQQTIIKLGSHSELTRWGYGLPKNGTIPQQKAADDARSCWETKKGCLAEFRYKGETYIGCTEVGSEGQGWCSMDAVYVGRWQSCTDICKAAVPVKVEEKEK